MSEARRIVEQTLSIVAGTGTVTTASISMNNGSVVSLQFIKIAENFTYTVEATNDDVNWFGVTGGFVSSLGFKYLDVDFKRIRVAATQQAGAFTADIKVLVLGSAE